MHILCLTIVAVYECGGHVPSCRMHTLLPRCACDSRPSSSFFPILPSYIGHLAFPCRFIFSLPSQLTGLCFGSPSRRSNGSLGHPSIPVHMVLRSFTMTATVANTADIRRPTNLERTDYSNSDTTIRRNYEDAMKTCSSNTRNTTKLPAHVPRRCQNRRPSLESLRPKPMPGEVRAQQRPHVEFCN